MGMARPAWAVTVMSTGPAVAAAEAVAVIWVSLSTVKNAAGAAPKSTAVAPRKSVPVTLVPPASAPCVGLIAVMSGAGSS